SGSDRRRNRGRGVLHCRTRGPRPIWLRRSSTDKASAFRERTIRRSSWFPRRAAIRAEYRTGHYLDKDDPTREATEIMTVAVPIGNAKTAAEAKPERVGVLLVNLGTPDICYARGVRVYPLQF